MHANRKSSSFFLLAVVLAGAAGVACGGSPAGPSGSATLQGVVLQGGSGASAQSGATAQSMSGGRIKVTVRQNPALTTTVSGNGTFQLDGVPTDGFTLVFTLDGATMGTISISPVQGATKIKIVVQVTGGNVELVNLDLQDENENDNNDQNGDAAKTCMINGGKVGARIELEGNVDSGTGDAFKLAVNGNRSSGLVDVSASGASYKCNGQKKGTDCKASLTAGDKVHVRGTLTTCTTTAASVTATEVMVQK